MDGFYITVSNGLLKDGHPKRMGGAVWEFLWCLDKMTRIEEGIGYVLGGKPIQLKDIANDLGLHLMTVSRNLKKLTGAGYLATTRAPSGLKITVLKAKKRFNKSVRGVSGNVYSRNGNVESRNGNVDCNIRQNTDDRTEDKTMTEPVEVFEVIKYLKEKLRTDVLDGTDEENRHYAKLCLQKFGASPAEALKAVKRIIDLSRTDPFHAAKATDLKYICNNGLKIIAAAAQRSKGTELIGL